MRGDTARHSGEKLKMWIAVAISTVALFLLGLHLWCKSTTVDAVGLGLLGIAMIPWVGMFIGEFEGFGVKIKTGELEKVRDQVADSEIASTRAVLADADKDIADLGALPDPNLALAGLRIELEKALRKLYVKSSGVPHDQAFMRSAGRLAEDLVGLGRIDPGASMAIQGLLVTLNKAVHGADVGRDARDEAMAIGRQVLAWLQAKLDGPAGTTES